METMEDFYGRPLTSKQFIQLFNFNNPSIEDAWDDAVSEFVEDRIETPKRDRYVSPSAIGEHKIKVCYL